MSNIGKGAPYRPPCWGWVTRVLYGHCARQVIKAHKAIQKYLNVTTVAAWLSYGPRRIPPYSRPSSTLYDCGGPDDLPCGPWPDPPLANVYQLAAGQTVDLTACQKWGFKNVFAWKAWHGRNGFKEMDGCIVEGPTCFTVTDGPAVTVKWLRRAAEGITTAWSLNTFGAVGTLVQTSGGYGRQTIAVDRATGKITVDGDLGTVAGVLAMDYKCGLFVSGGPEPIDFLIATLNDAANFVQADPVPALSFLTGLPTGTWDWSSVPGGAGNGVQAVKLTVANRQISFTLRVYHTNGYNLYDGAIVLQDPYFATDVATETRALLAQWNLTDDAQYPWRHEQNVTHGPLVTRWEKQPTAPPNLLDPYYQDDYPGDGRILGAPLAAGSNPYFDSRFLIYVDHGAGLEIDHYGDFAPDWARHATQWTDESMASWLLPKAFVAFGNPAPGPMGPIVNGCCVMGKWAEIILPTWSHNFARPCGTHDLQERSHVIPGGRRTCDDGNSSGWPARWPAAFCFCADRRWQRDPVTGGCEVPSGPGTLDAREAAKLAADRAAMGAPFAPNDTGSKGDFTIRRYAFDQRDWSENQRRITAGGTIDLLPDCNFDPGLAPLRPVTEGWSATSVRECTVDAGACAKQSPCRPWAVFVQPEAPTGTDGQPFASTWEPMPIIPLDERWGSLWQAEVIQWMPDPLWQPPLQTCADQDGLLPWNEDDGTCVGDYPMRPWEEARATVPAGYPPLPAGTWLGGSCLSVAEVNAGLAGITGEECTPPEGGAEATGAPQNAWLTWWKLQGTPCNPDYAKAAEDRTGEVPEVPVFE